MKCVIGKLLVACAILFIMTTSALAVPIGYNFQYEFATGEIFSGMLEGELQADLDTIIVSSVLMASFSGLPGVGFQTDIVQPFNVVTISGEGGSFGSVAPADGKAAFFMPLNQFGNTAVIATQADITFRAESFAAERWSLAPKAVPAPASLALFLLGFLGLGWSRVKKI